MMEEGRGVLACEIIDGRPLEMQGGGAVVIFVDEELIGMDDDGRAKVAAVGDANELRKDGCCGCAATICTGVASIAASSSSEMRVLIEDCWQDTHNARTDGVEDSLSIDHL